MIHYKLKIDIFIFSHLTQGVDKIDIFYVIYTFDLVMLKSQPFNLK